MDEETRALGLARNLQALEVENTDSGSDCWIQNWEW